jgi:putative DNA primase/helicase
VSGDASVIARALGGKQISDGFLSHCPVPNHGQGRGDRNPSLLVKDGDNALLFKCFAGCDTRDVLTELRRRGVLDDRPLRQDRPPHGPANYEPAHEPDAAALAIWRAAGPIAGSIAEKFERLRGITIDLPPSLRAGNLPYLERYQLPAMIAAVQAPDRRIIAVQTTFIDPRGDRKAQVRLPRKTTGALGRGAVRLAAATDVLGLAEGTEKALAAMQLSRVPCWSSLGAGRMHRVWIPDRVELHIFADNDDVGRAAAERVAHAHRHRKVILHFPPEKFKDWDDVTAASIKERSDAE